MYTYEVKFDFKPKHQILLIVISLLILGLIFCGGSLVGRHLATAKSDKEIRDYQTKILAIQKELKQTKFNLAELKSAKEAADHTNYDLIQQLNDAKDLLETETKVLQLKNTAYKNIIEKWNLPIPLDPQLENFSIDSYLCATWCPWYTHDLPEIKAEYQIRDCPACDTAKKKKCSGSNCPSRQEVKVKCRGQHCYPTQKKTKDLPKTTERFLPGPTATCPDQK